MKSTSQFLCLILVLSSLSDSTQARQKRDRAQTRPETLLFKIPVWSNGAAQETPLGISDFKVLNGKTFLDIASLQPPESPMLLFIAFDTVGDINNINQARAGITKELESLGPQYWVGLISAQEQLSVLQEPTADRALLKQKIEELTQIGKAGLLESIQPIADLTTSILLKSEVRVAVIFITDSDIANYRADYLNPPVNASDSRDLSRRFAGRALQEKISRMTASLARYQAPIFIVHIDPGLDPLNRSYHNGLKQLAESVGGQCFLSKTTSDIAATIHEAFQRARTFYLLGFNAPAHKEGFQKIQVQVSGQDSRPLAGNLSYPSRIFIP